jgi:ABC-2 type transport system permease protein
MRVRTLNALAWLAVYDLRQQWRERGSRLLLTVALGLALLALAQGERLRRDTEASAAQALALQVRAQVRAQEQATSYFANPADPQFAEAKWWRSAFDLRGYAFREHVGFAVKPSLPGAALAIGQGDVLPAVARVRAESMDSVRQAADIDHPQRLASGRFDLQFFVVSLWPLALLAFTLSALTLEREHKRLPALALLGIGPGQVLLAQVLARVLSATAALVLTVGAAALLAGALPPTAGGLLAWASWTALVLAYSLFWAGVSALVCARASSRGTAAFAGFGAWVGIVVLLPALLAAIVSLAAPLPQRERTIVAMRNAADAVQANRVAVMARFYDQHPEWRPERTALDKLPSSVTRLARAVELERALAGVEAGFEQARRRQARLLQAWGVLSPVSRTHEALSVLGGQDSARHQAFLAEVQAHQQQLRSFFQARIQQAALADERQPCVATCLGGYGFTDFAAVPRFTAGPALTAASGIASDVMVLLIWSTLLLGLAAKLAEPSGRSQRAQWRAVAAKPADGVAR